MMTPRQIPPDMRERAAAMAHHDLQLGPGVTLKEVEHIGMIGAYYHVALEHLIRVEESRREIARAPQSLWARVWRGSDCR